MKPNIKNKNVVKEYLANNHHNLKVTILMNIAVEIKASERKWRRSTKMVVVSNRERACLRDAIQTRDYNIVRKTRKSDVGYLNPGTI